MNNFEVLIPIFVCLGLFGMITAIFYLRNRERMAMIERGMDPRRGSIAPQPYQNLKWGLLLMGSGLGLFIAYLLDMQIRSNTHEHNPPLYFALVAFFGGLGLIISYRIEKKEVLEKQPLKDL